MRIAVPVSSALLGWTKISSNAARSEGTACFKLAFSFTIYSLMYSLVASPDVVLVIGDELLACRYRFSGRPISTYMSLTLARLCGEWRNGRTGVMA